jgi:hypothetical protein
MKSLHWTAALLLPLAAALPALTDDQKQDDGFVPMFNGKDLTGWVNVNCAPGTFYVKNGEIITTGKPTGYLRTTKQYENFIAEFDWMHVPPKPGEVGNSGFFVWADPIPAIGTGYTRGIEVQVLVNLTYKNKKGEITATSQGDLFSIHGATCMPDRPHPDGWARCLPSENYCKGEREWNHYRVEANDGVIKLAVNGHVVSGVSQCKPRKGYLALESEGSECHFKNLKIKQLPSTDPKPDEVADEDLGFKNLYTGLDLSGWKAREDWTPQDGVLHHGGNGRALYTDKEYDDAEFIIDFRFPQKGKNSIFVFREGMRGSAIVDVARDGTIKANRGPDSDSAGKMFKDLKPAGEWNRLHVTVQGKSLKVTINEKPAAELEITGLAPRGTFGVYSQGEMDFRNLFVRDLK